MRGWTLHGVVSTAVLVVTVWSQAAFAQKDVLAEKPDAIVDLMTSEGTQLLQGQWRYSDAKVVEVDHHWPGIDLGPSGPPNRTLDLVPHAGMADFDDSQWDTIEPPSLEQRRGNGRLCFNWYRINITIPDKIGSFDPTGSTVVFEIVVDDYAEIWVNGKLPLVLGQTGGQLIKGFNAPNRVVVARNVKPKQHIQLAVLGANGPRSNPPGNFIWVRSASLDFYSAARFEEAAAVLGARPIDAFFTVASPLAARGYLTASVLGFAHTLGEFGVVLMVGGNIPGRTRVISIAIYEQVETLDFAAAHVLSAGLLAFSFAALVLVYVLNRRYPVHAA